MADSFVSRLISELTEKTTAEDTDLIPVSDKSGNFFKMTWKKLKELMLGTKDISGVGDGTVTGAISELNTNSRQGGVRFLSWQEINNTTIYYSDYRYPVKIFSVNGWDSSIKQLTPEPNSAGFWIVIHIPCQSTDESPSVDLSYITQIWIKQNGNMYIRTYNKNDGWKTSGPK